MRHKKQLNHCIALFGVMLLVAGCSSHSNKPSDPNINIALSFSDGSRGICTLKNTKGSWTTTIPNRSVTVYRSKDPLHYQCTTEDGRESIGKITSNIDFGKMVARLFSLDFGGSNKHRSYEQTVVIPTGRKPHYEKMKYDK